MIKVGMYISDRYEIIDKVGSGGMADVYKAKCHRLNRYVAIKILKPEYSSDKNFVTKFRGEAQSAAGLSHPNIVNVYDVGEDNGLYYIVMELVEGITLKRFIERKGHLEVKEAVGIGIQIAQGMEAAHANHIIHRDIKPQNIIISREGKVKVTDFGIAKAATSNTVTQNAIGSVHYLSPEQARGGYSDERSDIYSLGVTLYEMLTGKVPFAGDNTVSVALLHIQGEATPVRELNPSVPVSLDRIVQKCMQKKQERRHQSASELITDLKRCITNPDGDFVKLNSGVVTDSPTIKMTDGQMKEIETAARTPVTYYSNSDLNKVKKIQKEEEEDIDSMDSRLEKALTVGTVIAVIIVGIVVLYVIANFFGLFDFLNPNGNESLLPTSAPVATDAPTPTISPTPTPELVQMPYVIGLKAEDAVDSLTTVSGKFTIVYDEDYSEEYDEGFIIKQYPNSGAGISKSMTITLTVSTGKEPVKLPNVYNLSVSEAKETLSSKGYSTEVEYEYSTTVADGNIIRTLPERFETVDQGSRIVLYVSLGPSNVLVQVPNVLGKTLDEATTELTAGKLLCGTVSEDYSSEYEKGLVCLQSAGSDTQATEGSAIDLTISLGINPDPTPTPEPTPTTEPDDSTTETSTDGVTSTPVPDTADPTSIPDEPEPTPTPEAETGTLKYRGSVAITDSPFTDDVTVADITLELIQGDNEEITIYDRYEVTSEIFATELSMFTFSSDDTNLTEGSALVKMYVNLVPVSTTYAVSLEAFYE